MRKLTKLISEVKVLFLPTAILLTLTIVVLSLIKTDGLPKIEVSQADKYFHSTAYFALTLSWIFALKHQLNRKKKLTFLLLFLLIVLFGIVIEVLQMTVTDYRSFDFYDIVANSIGASLAFLFYQILRGVYSRFEARN